MLLEDRRTASKQIPIKRIFGLAKKYKILKKELPQSKANWAQELFLFVFPYSTLDLALLTNILNKGLKHQWIVE